MASMKPKLSLAMARVDEDFSAESAAVDEAMEQAANEIDAALEVIQAVQEDAPAPAVAIVKPRVKQARAWAEKNLAFTVEEEAKLQADLAEVNRRYESVIAAAREERDAAMQRISAELDDVTALRSCVAVLKGELVKVDF